jgi:hypothetical protein
MKTQIIMDIVVIITTLGILVGCTFIVLKELNNQSKEYLDNCQRISMNEFEDNCMCPCNQPTWIEEKLGLQGTCDGWIVKKNESCLGGIKDGLV